MYTSLPMTSNDMIEQMQKGWALAVAHKERPMIEYVSCEEYAARCVAWFLMWACS